MVDGVSDSPEELIPMPDSHDLSEMMSESIEVGRDRLT